MEEKRTHANVTLKEIEKNNKACFDPVARLARSVTKCRSFSSDLDALIGTQLSALLQLPPLCFKS